MAQQHGLSLLGFMSEPLALTYLKERCDMPDGSETALRQHWMAAKGRLGTAMERAGRPEIGAIPSGHEEYLKGVRQSPRFAITLENMPHDFALVEIAPLLSFQFHVERERAGRLRPLLDHQDVAALLKFTLPLELEPIQYRQWAQPSGVLITAANLNLRLMLGGVLGVPDQAMQMAGPLFGANSPLTQVVRFRERCYLKNGYHRAHLLLEAGITQMPCLLLDATEYARVGAQGGNATFDRELLESNNPPTCGHLTRERGYRVRLRSMRRVISVTWAEHTVADEG